MTRLPSGADLRAKSAPLSRERIGTARVWCARDQSEGFKESPSYGAEGFLQVIRYKQHYPGPLQRDFCTGVIPARMGQP